MAEIRTMLLDNFPFHFVNTFMPLLHFYRFHLRVVNATPSLCMKTARSYGSLNKVCYDGTYYSISYRRIASAMLWRVCCGLLLAFARALKGLIPAFVIMAGARCCRSIVPFEGCVGVRFVPLHTSQYLTKVNFHHAHELLIKMCNKLSTLWLGTLGDMSDFHNIVL